MGKIDRVPDTKQEWFKDAKYGLFIHFGLYSILAGEYQGKKTDYVSEWIMNSLGIVPEEYEKLASQFDPKYFDADALVKRAKKEWGMKYIVFTAKHHDGFAMYHSKVNPYNVVDASPCHRDILGELADACRKHDMKLGVYYSQAQDWDDPNGYVSHDNGKKDEQLQSDNSKKDFQYYLDHKALPQVRELLTNYGEIALVWYDTPMGMTKEQSEQCYRLVKELQPNCIVNGRIGNQLGDYMTTGDNFIPRFPFAGDWEVPATLNDTWGYNKNDNNWKNPDDIIKLLVRINSRGGNYLLNIGPKSNGEIPEESIRILNTVGKYVTENADGIYGTRATDPYPYELSWGELTAKKNKIFIHVFEPRKQLVLFNCANHVKSAYLLQDGRKLSFITNITCEGNSAVYVEIPEDLRGKKNYCVGLEIEEDNPVFEPIRV